MAVFVFNRKVKSPKIPFILVGRSFGCLINDAELNPVSAWRGNSSQGKEPEAYGLEHALLAPMAVVALLNAGPQIQFAPVDRVRPPIIVLRMKRMGFIKIKLPHVFAHGIPPNAPTSPKANMVVNLAVADERPGIFVFLAPGLFAPGGIF